MPEATQGSATGEALLSRAPIGSLRAFGPRACRARISDGLAATSGPVARLPLGPGQCPITSWFATVWHGCCPLVFRHVTQFAPAHPAISAARRLRRLSPLSSMR
jgi:hypothetical protein